jgi:death-on-curing protein
LPKRARRYLGVDAVLAIHAEVLTAHGGGAGLRDRSLLESAVAAPQASFGGEALIRDTVEIAAAYLYYLCRNHPFVDGNKRTALATALVFLKANGRLKDLGQPEKRIDDWEALVLDVASSKLDRLEVARRLRVLLRRRR